MNDKTLQYLSYWRNSLIDGSRSDGEIGVERPDNEKIISLDGWKKGRLDDPSVIKDLFEKANAPDDVPFIPLLAFPNLFQERSDHAVGFGGKITRFSAIVTAITMNREGYFIPNGQPLVPRRLLDPIYPARIIIGSLQTLDQYITKSPYDLEKTKGVSDWKTLIDYCEKLEQAVCDGIKDGQFERLDKVVLRVEDSVKAYQHIVSLYDTLKKENPNCPLMDDFAEEEIDQPFDFVRTEDIVHKHLGQMSPDYPLAVAQRDALYHFLTLEDGKILAINGPPGTGKTTLIQSVVGTLWIQSILDEKDPPVIVVASTNNQAVTNVIESFGSVKEIESDPISGRWLPESFSGSYGLYFAASQKKKGASEKGYPTQDDMASFENKEFVESSEKYFLECFEKYRKNIVSLSLEQSLVEIRDEIVKYAKIIEKITPLWKQRCDCWNKLLSITGNNPEETLSREKENYETLKKNIEKGLLELKSWINYVAEEPFWYSLFNFISSVRHKRRIKARSLIEGRSWVVPIPETMDVDDIESFIRNWIKTNEQELLLVQERKKKIESAFMEYSDADAKWIDYSMEIDIKKTRPDFRDVNESLDTLIRYRMFKLASHYWEGRWILETKNTILSNDPDNKGHVKTMRKWRRYAKLHPCTVSTFFKVPEGFKYWINRQDDKPLLNFIDLLIVDEAGQVLPEVAGASFSLAKKAIIVGDLKQIEPVWSVPGVVDVGNLLRDGIISDTTEEEIDRVMVSGKTASSGSVMAIAQRRSPYHYDRDLDRGMYLYEHRRCADNIIEYCNDLCYKGKLIPKTGNPSGTLFPQWGYAHIVGKSSERGGSRCNVVEAESIVNWVSLKKKEIESHYGKNIGDILGIVTPFSSQSRTINRFLSDKLGSKHGITVGTVHSLQGAERKIVIFSPVYSVGDIGNRQYFFDKGSNMLNVAVSRAKDSFIVIGNMYVFDESRSALPSGIMGKYLFRKKENEILDIPVPERNDLFSSQKEIECLKTLTEHESLLKEVLSGAKIDVVIVSPWIRAHGYAHVKKSMFEAVSRGISVTVYTDKHFNEKENAEDFWKIVDEMKENQINIKIVQKVHSKLLFMDDSLMCSGSFNWISARRDNFSNMETSLVYRSQKVREEKDAEIVMLENRIIRVTKS